MASSISPFFVVLSLVRAGANFILYVQVLIYSVKGDVLKKSFTYERLSLSFMYFIFCETDKSLVSFEFPDYIFLITYSILHIVTKSHIPMVETLSNF